MTDTPRCPASGMLEAACRATICDCFPDLPDRFGLHPEAFVLGTPPEES